MDKRFRSLDSVYVFMLCISISESHWGVFRFLHNFNEGSPLSKAIKGNVQDCSYMAIQKMKTGSENYRVRKY